MSTTVAVEPIPLDFILVQSGDEHLPRLEDVPEEFREKDNVYALSLQIKARQGQIPYSVHWKAQAGIDKRQAIDAINTCLSSCPIAVCAYLLSIWFEL
jgi:hypothetical protein